MISVNILKRLYSCSFRFYSSTNNMFVRNRFFKCFCADVSYNLWVTKTQRTCLPVVKKLGCGIAQWEPSNILPNCSIFSELNVQVIQPPYNSVLCQTKSVFPTHGNNGLAPKTFSSDSFPWRRYTVHSFCVVPLWVS